MSKIKSKKVTYAKVLLGVVLAFSLTTTFALDQQKVIKKEAPPVSKTETISDGKTETILFLGKPLQVSGDYKTIESLKSFISRSKMEKKLPPPPPLPTGTKIGGDGSDKDVFVVVDEMPEYPGGVAALRTFLANNVKYPIEAAKKGIQGKVFVNFVVEKDGTVGLVKIARGVDPSLDAEAMRVVKLLTNWKPGKQKGEDVRVSYTVPINFALQ
jgi:TonB family protein